MVRKTKADAELTRQQIIDAARRVFVEKGVSRTTIDNIAAAAGVTRGAVYWHFANKEALFHAMRDQVTLPLLDRLGGSLLRPNDADPLDAIARFHLGLFDTLQHDPVARQVYEIMILKCEYVEEFAHELANQQAYCSEIVGSLAHAYRQAARVGQLRPGLDPDLVALDTFIFISGLIKGWLADAGSTLVRPRIAGLIHSHLALRRN